MEQFHVDLGEQEILDAEEACEVEIRDVARPQGRLRTAFL